MLCGKNRMRVRCRNTCFIFHAIYAVTHYHTIIAQIKTFFKYLCEIYVWCFQNLLLFFIIFIFLSSEITLCSPFRIPPFSPLFSYTKNMTLSQGFPHDISKLKTEKQAITNIMLKCNYTWIKIHFNLTLLDFSTII